MGTDVINTTDALVAVYDEMTVLIGPTGGDPPGLTDYFDDVYCVRVVQSASGQRLDYAELVHNLRDHLQDRAQPDNFARMIDARLPDGDGTLIHRGDYVRESAGVNDGESLTAQSQLRSYHFGNPLTGYDVFAVSGFSQFINSDIVFNPLIDNRTLFNMSNKNRNGDVALNGRLWVHPESISATVGETWQGQTKSEWTLSHAVRSLCWLLNPTEPFILNPSTESIDRLIVGPSVRAVTIPIGTRLPQALDLLLRPLGFNWHIDYTTADTAGLPQIRIFQIGAGPEKELYLQPPGSILDLAESNINAFTIDNNIGDSFNQVTVLGEYEEAECTFPLFAAWDATHDSITPDDLDKDGAEYVGHETVWRLFIANEAGDINPATSRLGQTPTVPDLTGVFELWVAHHRTLQEPLTYIAGTPSASTPLQERRPHVVEYSDDSGATWLAAPETWTVKLCPDQIGILFDGKTIPQELYDAGSSGRLRITGSVFGDSRIKSTATRNAWAVNGRVVENVMLRPDKFQYRFRNIAGTYQSVLTGSADTKDHSTEISDFAEAIRDQNQYAEVDCEFKLPGWHLEYEIGDLITKINGREISLDAAPASAPVNRYVQIVERRFEMSATSGPQTILIVDRGIDENPTQRLNFNFARSSSDTSMSSGLEFSATAGKVDYLNPASSPGRGRGT